MLDSFDCFRSVSSMHACYLLPCWRLAQKTWCWTHCQDKSRDDGHHDKCRVLQGVLTKPTANAVRPANDLSAIICARSVQKLSRASKALGSSSLQSEYVPAIREMQTLICPAIIPRINQHIQFVEIEDGIDVWSHELMSWHMDQPSRQFSLQRSKHI